MGQYHVIANVTKRVGYSPRSVGSFVKLMELGHTSSALAPLFLLLDDTWGGDRIALVGDYADTNDLHAQAQQEAGLDAEDIYSAVAHNKESKEEFDIAGWKPVGWLARKMLTDHGLVTLQEKTMRIKSLDGSISSHSFYNLEEVTPDAQTEPRVLVNLDRNEVLHPEALGDRPEIGLWAVEGVLGGMITATAILLGVSSTEGGRGGGDFHTADPLVGSWGGDRLDVVAPDDAAGFTDISASVRELIERGREGAYKTVHGRVQRSEDLW